MLRKNSSKSFRLLSDEVSRHRGFPVKDKKQRLFTPQLNHISMKLPSFPLLSQRHLIKPDQFCNSSTVEGCEKDFCACTHVLRVKVNSVVELVLIDEGTHAIGNYVSCSRNHTDFSQLSPDCRNYPSRVNVYFRARYTLSESPESDHTEKGISPASGDATEDTEQLRLPGGDSRARATPSHTATLHFTPTLTLSATIVRRLYVRRESSVSPSRLSVPCGGHGKSRS